ncbi:MAG: alanyl-tRNA editing protein [Clostridiales bacterium]|nr:alanyl-tRNA editing protein [Clostridiales bacterium]
MSTERIYRKDVYAVSNEAVVTAVCEKNGCDVIACDASVFYPEGGGQPSDTGTVSVDGMASVFEISRASDKDLESDVWHETDAPAGTFKAGDRVTLTIDWDHRFRNMQRHCGEHMLSGAMYELFGGVNKGFHMGDDYITIDIDLDGRMLTDEELDLAQSRVNEAVWSDLPVTVTWFDDYESSLAYPVRKKVPHEGRVSVVTVGDPADPFDCIACCGTHPASSAEVGLVAIYKCEPNKGMNRVFFDCGKAAFDKLTADSALLADAAKRYSCAPADLPSRLDIEAENVSALKGHLAELTAYVKEAEKQKIIGEIGSRQSKCHVYKSDILSADDLLKLGFSVINEIPGLFLIMEQTGSNTCLLLSSSEEHKCGQLVKEYAPQFNGRGGGRPDNARALFSSLKDMQAFADAVTASL